MSTSDKTIRWIENLADQEKLIESGDRTAIDLGTTKGEVLFGETAAFLSDLHYHFEYLLKLFNARVDKDELEIRISKNNVRPSDFHLERNGMRLTLSGPTPGIISIRCDKLVRSPSTAKLKSSMMFTGSIEARFGTFHDVEWYFLRTRATAEQVARHYLTEFIQMSREPSLSN